MGKEKTRTEIIENIIDKENEVPSKLNVPSDTKYKKQRNSDPDNLPNLKVGLDVVVRLNKTNNNSNWNYSDVDGYLLCKILDFDTDERFWYAGTDIIVVVLKVSQIHLSTQIGRIYSVNYLDGNAYFSKKRMLVSFDKNFVKWVL